MKKTSETTDLGHKPLVHPFISLTQQEDGSPCNPESEQDKDTN